MPTVEQLSPAGLSLRSILPEARMFGRRDIQVRSCCGHAEQCRPGDLYVAIVDPDGDGHDPDRIAEALRHGASAVLAESYLPLTVPQAVVQDSREAYGRICHALAGRPAESLQLIGVTGSQGKTSTTVLAASVLRAGGLLTGFTGTLVHSDSANSEPAVCTTPAPPEMTRWLTRMADQRCTHAVLELSSRGLAQRRTAGLEFDAAVLTNLRNEHLDYHGSVVNYRRAKMRLLEQLRPAGFAILNADDPGCQTLLQKAPCPALTFGIREPAEVTGKVLERHPSEQTFLIRAGQEAMAVRTRIIGDDHLANCLAAAALGLVYGIDLPTIARGLEAVEQIPGRLERIECGQPFSVFVDCSTSPAGLTTALRTLRNVTRGRLLCVMGADSIPDDQRPLVGRVVERHANLGVLTSGPSGHAEPLAVAHDYLDGYARPGKAHVIPTRYKAIHWALSEARAGDVVLIAGSDRQGFLRPEMQEVPADSELVKQWLRRPAPPTGLRIFRGAELGQA